MKKIFLIILIVILFSSPLISSATGLVPCGRTDPTATAAERQPCQLCHFFVLFNNVVDFLLFKIVPSLAVLMLVIGGFMYIFAYFGPAQLIPGGGKGGPALLGQAKKLITSVVIGIVIMFGAWAIVNTFFQAIGVEEWTGLKTWWEIKGCPAEIKAPPATTPPPATPPTAPSTAPSTTSTPTPGTSATPSAPTTKTCYCSGNDCWQSAEGCDNIFKSLCQTKQVPISATCSGTTGATPPPTTETPSTPTTKTCYCSGERCYTSNSSFLHGCSWGNAPRTCVAKQVPINTSCAYW